MTTPPLFRRSLLGHVLLFALLLVLAVWLWRLQGAEWPALTPRSDNRLTAALVSALWVIATSSYMWLLRANKPATQLLQATAGWHVVHASQTGFAFELAQRTVETLHAAGKEAQLVDLGEITPKQLQGKHCLIIASTTGEGDPPDSALPFVRHMRMQQAVDLSTTHFALLALGDRSYSQFCGFGHQLQHWLMQQGASPLFDTIEVDNAANEALQHWQQQLHTLLASPKINPWAAIKLQDWVLHARELLNAGSQGWPAYHIVLRPPSTEQAHWLAGDIAEIHLDANTRRDYSIASIPGDGQIELLIRRMPRPDGSPGLGSGFLCEQANLGDTIKLRIRSNPNFHSTNPATPLILIGNGTGIAALRAHIKARATLNNGQTWLLYGERSLQHDAFFHTELMHWKETGALTHLDRTFSRDGHAQRYVQDALYGQQQRLIEWVKQGAMIFVCGSQEGMAPGVDNALNELLGAATLTHLRETGRYRRDVY